MKVEIGRYQNRKGIVCEGIFVDGKLEYPLSGYAQVRRGLVAHCRELGDRLCWLYTVLILIAKPVGEERGSLEIELRVLAALLGKSTSQVGRDLNMLASHRNRYIVYEPAGGRYSRKARIIIPKYMK